MASRVYVCCRVKVCAVSMRCRVEYVWCALSCVDCETCVYVTPGGCDVCAQLAIPQHVSSGFLD